MPAADLVAIAAQGSPVLCFDTCTALDLMRNPAREEIKPHDRTAAMDLLAAAEQGRLVVLMADQVAREIGDNLQSTEDDAVKGLTKLVKQADEVHVVHDASLPSPGLLPEAVHGVADDGRREVLGAHPGRPVRRRRRVGT